MLQGSRAGAAVRWRLACLTKLRILNIIVSHTLRNKSYELEAVTHFEVKLLSHFAEEAMRRENIVHVRAGDHS
jgi:hypothetical protein